MNCTLCDSHSVSEFAITRLAKKFFRCDVCKLVFLNPKQRMSFFEEKARYQTHNNNIQQSGYRRFLSQMWEPLKDKVTGPGLDFGCGPTTAFSILAAEDNIEVLSYDPYFFNDKDLLTRQYNFVWCSEVFEHFNCPKDSVEQAFSLVIPGGIVAIMTDPYPEETESFRNWGYHNDPTHISFYSPDTMKWIAAKYQLNYRPISKRVTLFS